MIGILKSFCSRLSFVIWIPAFAGMSGVGIGQI